MVTSIAEDEDLLHLPSIGEFIFGVLAGAVFIAFSIPLGLIRFGNLMGWPILETTGRGVTSLLANNFGTTRDEQLLSFSNLWSKLLLLLAIYLGALVLLSLRHGRFDFFGSGLLFLVLGIASLHIIAWTLYILGWILYFIGIVLTWILHLFVVILLFIGGILAFIGSALVRFFFFLLSNGLWLVLAIALVALIIFLLVKYRDEFLEFIIAALIFLGTFAAFIGVTFLLVKLWEFLLPYLAPIIAFLRRVLDFLLLVLFYGLIVLVIFALGAVLLDQLRGAWKAGNGRRGVMLGALAIGTSLALILVESNLYNVITYFPSMFASLSATYLQQSSPIFDVIVALLVICIAIFGLVRNLPKLLTEPTLREFHLSAVLTIVLGLGLGLLVIVAASQSQSS